MDLSYEPYEINKNRALKEFLVENAILDLKSGFTKAEEKQ